MSMTREKAIALFEKQLTAAQVVLDSGFGGNPGENDFLYRRRKEMAEIALTALRPVSREQVDKVFPGCRSCKSCRSCVFSIHAIKDMPCKKCDPNAEGVLTEYKPSNFCPVCGKPLTDEAVDMVMERLEEMRNG